MWLGNLLERVNTGLESGIYESFNCEDDHLGFSPDEESIHDYTSLSFFELLRFTPQTEDVICVDDRFTNGFAHRDGAPVVSLMELLEVLRINNKINQSKLFEIYLKLRMANTRFIPLTSKEIFFHLEQARIVDGQLVETLELSVLRRYLASCLLDSNRLQRPPMPSNVSNSQGELAFILGTLRAVREAIIKCWRDASTDSNASKIRANWLLENLYTGIFGIRHLRPVLEPESDGLDLIGLDVGGAFSEGIKLPGRGDEETDVKSPRKQYFEWLENQVLFPRLFSEPGAKVAIAQAVHRFIAEMRKTEVSSPEDELVQKALIQQMYVDIPEIIKDEMKSDPEFLTYIGVQIVESVGFENLVFPKAEFWQAATKAMNGECSSVGALEPPSNYNFERINQVSSSDWAIQIKSEADSTEFNFQNPMLGLLPGAANDWENLIRANRSWFDCENQELEKIIGDVLTTTEPLIRVEKVQKWYEKSATIFYAQLKNKIIDSGQFKFEELIPPSADRLLDHYRLKPLREEENFSVALGEASLRLIQEEGLQSTLQRMLCIPVQLPEPILQNYGNLPETERRKLLSDVEVTMVAPVCLIHLVFLALKFDGHTSWGMELSRKAISILFGLTGEEEKFSLFQSLLSWVNEEFSFWADAKVWQAPIKLAMIWAHASHLYNIFQLAGAKPSELVKFFNPKRSRIASEIFDRDLNCWNDVIHPTRLNRSVFLVHSLAKLLKDLDVELLRQASILKHFQEAATKTLNVQSFEDLLLARDSKLAEDNLGSFLGGDRWQYLKEILNSSESQTFLAPNLFSMTESTLDSLIENPNVGSHWLQLTAFIGDLPIYRELQNKLKILLERIDLEALFEIDQQAAVLAIYFTTNQSFYVLDEDGKSSLINKVVNLAQKIDYQFTQEHPTQSSRSQDDQDKIISLIYNSILSLSIKPRNPRGTSKTFSGLLEKLSKVAPNFLNTFHYALTKFVFELPSSHLHGLWPLILLTRARARS